MPNERDMTGCERNVNPRRANRQCRRELFAPPSDEIGPFIGGNWGGLGAEQRKTQAIDELMAGPRNGVTTLAADCCVTKTGIDFRSPDQTSPRNDQRPFSRWGCSAEDAYMMSQHMHTAEGAPIRQPPPFPSAGQAVSGRSRPARR